MQQKYVCSSHKQDTWLRATCRANHKCLMDGCNKLVNKTSKGSNLQYCRDHQPWKCKTCKTICYTTFETYQTVRGHCRRCFKFAFRCELCHDPISEIDAKQEVEYCQKCLKTRKCSECKKMDLSVDYYQHKRCDSCRNYKCAACSREILFPLMNLESEVCLDCMLPCAIEGCNWQHVTNINDEYVKQVNGKYILKNGDLLKIQHIGNYINHHACQFHDRRLCQHKIFTNLAQPTSGFNNNHGTFHLKWKVCETYLTFHGSINTLTDILLDDFKEAPHDLIKLIILYLDVKNDNKSFNTCTTCKLNEKLDLPTDLVEKLSKLDVIGNGMVFLEDDDQDASQSDSD